MGLLDGILSSDQVSVLKEERSLLADIGAELALQEVSDDDRGALAASVEQLDDLFLVVVVGEFNAGKSSLLNALVGEAVLAEGVTPTTSQIHLVRWGEKASRNELIDGVEEVHLPLPLLREITLVDTPGTNALERRHEALTEEYVPRSDLVLFVTSSDRPLSESERQFLQRVKQWGKKVVVVVNKVDILQDGDAVEEVLAYVRENGETILGVAPRVFGVSAALALKARRNGGDEAQDAGGLKALETYLRQVLDRNERVRLKLENPVGVAQNVMVRAETGVEARLDLIADDIKTLADITRQLDVYSNDILREFGLRLSDIDTVLHGLELRGIDFFDERLRLNRLPSLFDKEKLQNEFEKVVVGSAPAEIEQKVEALIDWLVASDLNQWQAVVSHVNRRQSVHADRVVGEVGTRFDYDRAALLESLGRASKESLASYDRALEARQMAESVQKAVTGTALAEAGALGLGATVALMASSTAVDVTGLAAAGLLAVVGLFILPVRRRQAKADLREKIGALRAKIMSGLTRQFDSEAAKSLDRIRETIGPYDRFVRAEQTLLQGQKGRLAELGGRLRELKDSIARVTES
ncbi:MAG: dynamin [Acidobacteria bacterium]|nr:MAG: dynamin [Acidobacteriota bacterium]